MAAPPSCPLALIGRGLLEFRIRASSISSLFREHSLSEGSTSLKSYRLRSNSKSQAGEPFVSLWIRHRETSQNMQARGAGSRIDVAQGYASVHLPCSSTSHEASGDVPGSSISRD